MKKDFLQSTITPEQNRREHNAATIIGVVGLITMIGVTLVMPEVTVAFKAGSVAAKGAAVAFKVVTSVI